MRTWSIRAKAVVLVFPLLLVAGGALLSWVHERSVRIAARESLASGARLYTDLETADVEKLSSTLRALGEVEALRRAFRDRDRERLLALARPVFEDLERRFRVTHWYFTEAEPKRTVFLRVHKPEVRDDVVNRATLLGAVATKQVASGKELGKTAFALRVVQPWYEDGKLLGYLELGEEIDHFLARMRQLTGDHYGLLLAKRHLDGGEWSALRARTGQRNDWDDRRETVLANATGEGDLVEAPRDPESLPDEGVLLAEVSRGKRTYVRGAFPVRDAVGKKVGTLFVLHDITAMRDAMLSGRVGSIAAIAAAFVAVCGLLLLFLDRLVFRRVRKLMARLEDASTRLAGGDYSVVDEIGPAPSDEIGRFEAFFGRFLRLVASMLQELESRQPPRTGTARR